MRYLILIIVFAGCHTVHNSPAAYGGYDLSPAYYPNLTLRDSVGHGDCLMPMSGIWFPIQITNHTSTPTLSGYSGSILKPTSANGIIAKNPTIKHRKWPPYGDFKMDSVSDHSGFGVLHYNNFYFIDSIIDIYRLNKYDSLGNEINDYSLVFQDTCITQIRILYKNKDITDSLLNSIKKQPCQ